MEVILETSAETSAEKPRKFIPGDKRKFIKALVDLKRKGKLLTFREHKNGIENKGVISFSLILSFKPEPLFLTFYATNRLLAEGCLVVREMRSDVHFLVGPKFLWGTIGICLADILRKLKNGLTMEREAIARGKRILQEKGKGVEWYGIRHIEDSKKDEDIIGIDMLVTSTSGKVTPVQIKVMGVNTRTHQEKFPDVPLIHYNPSWTHEEYFSVLAKICQAYELGKIIVV